ncbi:I78 family peptidase inhibitor [Pseudomonas sp. SBB6]|uniref:I78 family peptidase inhibitor n=1 Tax=Pseudomonas sp. SBB6 TaxID=2962032 RepID=UPI0020B72550|nr:I78 family peptidase inhibitor [Pseudomonas sp. SBB6]MCP3751439.1 I78 family peptidase inhibitor [Pseudomonas sp. SBB6]
MDKSAARGVLDLLPSIILGLSLALVGWLLFSVVIVELAQTISEDSSAYFSDEQACTSESVEVLFGQEVGKDVLLVAKVLSGVSSVRVLSMPGRDLSFVPDRLNLEVNEQKRIVGAFCG